MIEKREAGVWPGSCEYEQQKGRGKACGCDLEEKLRAGLSGTRPRSHVHPLLQAMKHPTRVCCFCQCRNGIHAHCLQINNFILTAYPICINNFYSSKKKKSLQGLAIWWPTWVKRVTVVNSISNAKLFNKPWKALKSWLFVSILLWSRSQSKLKHHVTFLVFLKYWRTMCVILLYNTRLKGELLLWSIQIFRAGTSGHSSQVRELKRFGKEINANQQKVWNGPEISNIFGTATAKAGLLIMGTSTELAGNAKENVRKKISEFLTNRNTWHLWDNESFLGFLRKKYICVVYFRWKISICEKLTRQNINLL